MQRQSPSRQSGNRLTAETGTVGECTGESRVDVVCSMCADAPRPGTVAVPSEESLVWARADTLLENLRRTPMLRHRTLDEPRRLLRGRIATTLEEQGVLPRLATRIALQLILKFDPGDLGDQRVWRALGTQLEKETTQLRHGLRLSDRLITIGLPKLPASDVERLFDQLRAVDAKYGRTIAEAALAGADPRTMGQRYGRAFKNSVDALARLEPGIARTLAAAAFMCRHPLSDALAYLRGFEAVVHEFRGDCAFARTVARAAFTAPDPIQAARRLIKDYQRVVNELTGKDLEPTSARTIASIAIHGADPIATAYQLVDTLWRVEKAVTHSHPLIARSVALSCLRARDPLAAANAFVANYDRIMELIGAVDPRRARKVAHQACQSRDPRAWTERFLAQLYARHPASRDKEALAVRRVVGAPSHMNNASTRPDADR